MPTILFTVTNNLQYDQRMQRICTSIQKMGFSVVLIGRTWSGDIELTHQSFKQKRIHCYFKKGVAFYIEYNFKLFFYLLTTKANAICAIDLDTILPVLFASKLKKTIRVYDAHELFTEQKEIATRKNIKRIWLLIEGFAVPKFRNGYTVNHFIQQELNKRYGVNYDIVRNIPIQKKVDLLEKFERPTFLYQGAVNEGRSFETLIPAMQQVDATLLICGVGNFFETAKHLVKQYNLEDKVIFKGMVNPLDLQNITPKCFAGITIFEATGLNQYYSLANRFFDYMMAGIPQICVQYPEYEIINNEHQFAFMIPDVEINTISNALNNLLKDDVLYKSLHQNALAARLKLHWENEEQQLITFWKKLFT